MSSSRSAPTSAPRPRWPRCTALAEEEKEAQTGGWADLAVPWIRRLVIVGIGLGVFQQFTGINSIMYYGSQLLEDAGFSAKAAIIANTANGLFSVLGITVGILLMNRVNRRTMLLVGFGLTTFFHLLVGLSAKFLPDNDIKPYFILLFVDPVRVLHAGHDRPPGVAAAGGDLPAQDPQLRHGRLRVLPVDGQRRAWRSASHPWWTRSASPRPSSSSPPWGCWP